MKCNRIRWTATSAVSTLMQLRRSGWLEGEWRLEWCAECKALHLRRIDGEMSIVPEAG